MDQNMRRIPALLAALALLLGLAACGAGGSDGGSDVPGAQAEIVVCDATEGEIAAIEASWSAGGERHDIQRSAAADGEALGGEMMRFYISADDVAARDLQDLTVNVQVTDIGGASFTLAPVAVPAEFGKTYRLELRDNDDRYELALLPEAGGDQ